MRFSFEHKKHGQIRAASFYMRNIYHIADDETDGLFDDDDEDDDEDRFRFGYSHQPKFGAGQRSPTKPAELGWPSSPVVVVAAFCCQRSCFSSSRTYRLSFAQCEISFVATILKLMMMMRLVVRLLEVVLVELHLWPNRCS